MLRCSWRKKSMIIGLALRTRDPSSIRTSRPEGIESFTSPGHHHYTAKPSTGFAKNQTSPGIRAPSRQNADDRIRTRGTDGTFGAAGATDLRWPHVTRDCVFSCPFDLDPECFATWNSP